MSSALTAVAGLLVNMALATAATPALASNDPDASAPVHELQTILRAEHPETFAGLWLDGEDVVVAAVSGDAAVFATAEEAYPEPARLRSVPAEYSEAEPIMGWRS